jgi:hypothetical protein
MNKIEAREQYNDYMRSEAWRELASAVRHDMGNCCEFCHAPAAEAILHCHHMTYERFGRENKEDLLVLCELHHSRYHEWFPGRRMPKMPINQLRPHVFEVLRKYENRQKLLCGKKKKTKVQKAAEGYERTLIMLRRARRIARAMERVKMGCANPKEERRANSNHSKMTMEWLDRVLAGEFGDSFDV